MLQGSNVYISERFETLSEHGISGSVVVPRFDGYVAVANSMFLFFDVMFHMCILLNAALWFNPNDKNNNFHIQRTGHH